MHRITLPLFFALTACIAEEPSTAPTPDEDSAVERPSDVDVEAPTFHYVLDSVRLPTTLSEAVHSSFDLDNDGQVDNQLGQVFATLNSMGWSQQPAYDRAISHGSFILLGEMKTDHADLSNGLATYTMYNGTNPHPAPCSPLGTVGQPPCGRHLLGTGSFDAPGPHYAPLISHLLDHQLININAGRLPFWIALGDTPFEIELRSVHIKLDVTTTNIKSGILAGAIPASQVDSAVVPSLAEAADAVIAVCRASHACTCPPGSTAAGVRNLLDANLDCRISAAEVRNNSLIQSLLAPDVTIGGEPALSFGVKVSAVHATFTP